MRLDDTLPHGRMQRLSPAFYQGHAFVHWNMTVQDRRTGWLTPAFHQRFREIQLHTLNRYRLLCLCYCLMPDHLHLLWVGLSEESDQDKAAAFFRKHFNRLLAQEAGGGAARLPAPGISAGAGSGSAPMLTLQKQAWDVVLREHDRERGAIERQLFYIAENPVRGCLVTDAYDWPCSGSQAAGYPDFDWRDKDFTERLWTIYDLEVRRSGAAERDAR
jgi:putative transposase